MTVYSYDDRKVSLRRPQGNGDLDIVQASYTRRKANVTEALGPQFLTYFTPRSNLLPNAFKWEIFRKVDFLNTVEAKVIILT